MAKKEVGQNFLIDPSAAKRIVDAAHINPDDKVLEIGCGAGSLTYFLGESNANIEAIDIDEGLLLKIQNDFKAKDNVNPHYGNAMEFDYSSYDVIVGNLPYYITSGIFEKVLLGFKQAKRCVFMVQKEAAERILAKAGTKEYSPLSILLYSVSKPKKEFNVGRNSFAPVPHVESTVISLEMKTGIDHAEIEKMHQLCNKLFLQRRKTVLNNLKAVLGEEKAKEALAKAGVSPMARPEQIEVEKYLMLSRVISA